MPAVAEVVQGLAQLKGGQSNPTFRLTAGNRDYVLRKKPEGVLLPSAHAVDREYRVMAALAATGVPVPQMLAFCDDSAVIGTPFYIMECVEGRIFWDPTLPGLTPGERRAHFDELNRVIAALHTVDYEAIGLDDFGRHGHGGRSSTQPPASSRFPRWIDCSSGCRRIFRPMTKPRSSMATTGSTT